MITVDNKHDIGDVVFLKTDPEQKERLVYALEVTSSDTLYKLACGTDISTHYQFEISTEKNVLKALES